MNQIPIPRQMNELPEFFSNDEQTEDLLLLQKIERGLADSAVNNVYTQEEAKLKLSKWLK